MRYDKPIELSATGNLAEDIYHTTVRIFANLEAQFTAAPEHWIYWDRFANRMSYEFDVKLPRGNESWSEQFTKLRRAVATEQSSLGRFLSGFEKNLHESEFLQTGTS